MNQKKNLLPLGFKDILENEANLQFEYGKKLITNFASWGFSFIEPPIIEYEKTLFDNKNKFLDKKTLSFLDPLTKERISLRPDITTQLARIAEDRLFGLPKPLRLCYFGDVFRADKPKLSSDRQFKSIQSASSQINSDKVKIGWNNNNSLILKKPSLIKDLDIDRVLLGH